MAKYQIEQNQIVDTDKAKASWPEERDFDGSNMRGKVSRSQWHYCELFKSSKDRYYLVKTSCVQGEADVAEWASPEDAATFLSLNNHEIPDDLAEVALSVVE